MKDLELFKLIDSYAAESECNQKVVDTLTYQYPEELKDFVYSVIICPKWEKGTE